MVILRSPEPADRRASRNTAVEKAKGLVALPQDQWDKAEALRLVEQLRRIVNNPRPDIYTDHSGLAETAKELIRKLEKPYRIAPSQASRKRIMGELADIRQQITDVEAEIKRVEAEKVKGLVAQIKHGFTELTQIGGRFVLYDKLRHLRDLQQRLQDDL